MNNCILLQQVQSISVASPSRVRSLKVLDLNIPGINGLKVLQETMWQAGLTTVVVSGLDEDRIHILGGIPSGVEVLPKPVPFARLMAIAQKLSETQCGATEQVSV